MSTRSRSTRPDTHFAAIGWIWACLTGLAILCWPHRVGAQSAYAMAWVFDGPGCRAGAEASPRGACADEALLGELAAWMGTQVGPVAAFTPPRLNILDKSGLAARLCPKAAAECEGIMAAYDASSRTILLRDFLDMRRAPDRSFLVHELAHVLQHQRQGDGFQAGCSEVVRSEREAYQLQNRYLAAQGQLQRVGQMMSMMVCPREDGEPVLRGAGLSATTTTAGPPAPPPTAP